MSEEAFPEVGIVRYMFLLCVSLEVYDTGDLRTHPSLAMSAQMHQQSS